MELDGEGALALGRDGAGEQSRCVHVEAVDGDGAGGVRVELADAGDGAVGFLGAFAGHGEHAGGLERDDAVAAFPADGQEGAVAGWRRVRMHAATVVVRTH